MLDGPLPSGEGRYIVAKLGEKFVAGVFPMEGEQFAGIPPHWMTYVKVDDVDVSAEKAAALGGTVKTGPFDVTGVGKIAIVVDAAGAVVGLIQPAD